GRDHWLVYEAGDEGFTSGREWRLPTGYPPGSFDRFESFECTVWNLNDLDGDGKTDLVVTRTCGDDRVGSSHWLLYRGGDAGFGAGEEWEVPQGFAKDTFWTHYGHGTCPMGDSSLAESWGLHDLTG